ncbi:alpha/beta hydrolase [Agromyces sp. NPDC058484]|uniref:alpha/beta hydrolase n=1 Tax=Agromyces sp. NPDC058484 TaxID=3346524 RepID=UPI00364E0D80
MAAAGAPSPVLLVGSPLLGGGMWEPVAALLRGAGRQVRVIPAPGAPVARPRDVPEVLARTLAAIPRDVPVVLVVHSNAGNLVPGIVCEREVLAAVFVDAVVPAASGTSAVAPLVLVEQLAPLADDAGLLPPWSRWFPDDAIGELGLEPAVLDELRRQEPRVPLSYLTDAFHVPSGWRESVPCAYVAFGTTYAREQRLAASLGWPVVVLDGRHLHPLVAPDEVAAAISSTLDALLPSSSA